MPSGGWQTDSGLLDRVGNYVAEWTTVETAFVLVIVLVIFGVPVIYEMRKDRQIKEELRRQTKVKLERESVEEEN